jgi:hypothetical protein
MADLCECSGSLSFGMFERWLHNVQVLLEQPVGLRDGEPQKPAVAEVVIGVGNQD